MALTANILESLQSDLRTISNESKRKLPPLREAAEAVLVILRALSNAKNQTIDVRQALYEKSNLIIDPFLMGCEFRQNQKVVQISLNAIQRLITYQVVKTVAACKLVDCLWNLMEINLEEVKVLQTATLLLSTNNVVSGPVLARTIVLCFRLYMSKNVIVNNIASATIRQLIANIFERLENEDAIEYQKEQQQSQNQPLTVAGTEALEYHSNSFFRKPQIDYDELKSFISGHLANLANALKMQYAPKSLRTSAADAFLLLRDLILLINDEQPLWLVGLDTINKDFVLELLELTFISFSDVLKQHEEFRFLIKERICCMILDLFSPDILNRNNSKNSNQEVSIEVPRKNVDNSNSSRGQITIGPNFTSVVADINDATESNKPISPSSMRVLRILSMLIQKFYTELITSSNIFTSIFVKLLENDSNLKQVSGPLKLARLSSADTGTAGTTISSVASSDIPVVTTMISKLFENSHLLKRIYLRRIVECLCKLSGEFIDGRVIDNQQHRNQLNNSSPSASHSPSNSDDLSNTSPSAPATPSTPTRGTNSNQEPSPYVLAKLLELGLVNLHRIGCIFTLLTDHFFEVSKHSNNKVRDWGACALTHLIKQSFCRLSSINSADEAKECQDEDLDEIIKQEWEMDQRKLLVPLQRLSQIPYPDIRQKQLDVVLQVIQSTTCDSILPSTMLPAIEQAKDALESLDLNEVSDTSKTALNHSPDSNQKVTDLSSKKVHLSGWHQIIDIISTVDDSQNDNLIRIAFQCLQGILNDYLSQMDCECIVLLIAAIVKFASQTHDLNVSLTSIGLLWNVADHLYQNRGNIEIELMKNKSSSLSNPNLERYAPNLAFIFEYIRQSDLSQYDSIWMALFAKLINFCIDSRPAIRKSACQTLFATITTHGATFELKTWEAVLWQILFPLLQQALSGVAPDMKLQTPAQSSHFSDSYNDDESLNSGCDQLAMHHSRNTAQKQWSETQVLALTGVTKVFTAKRSILVQIRNYDRAWNDLLEFIKSAALSKVFEVSLAALRCFQDLLLIEKIRKELTADVELRGQERMSHSLWLIIWVIPIIDLLPLYDESISVELREDYARCCFEALLQLSNFNQNLQTSNLCNNNDSSLSNSATIGCADGENFDDDSEKVSKLAVDYLLKRFMEVIIKYTHDESLAGKCPLPRNRMSEITFVLKAITTLLKSLKKVATSPASVKVWDQMLSLYPPLVDFATRNSPADQMRRDSLNQVLLEYGSLLCPPAASQHSFDRTSAISTNYKHQMSPQSSQTQNAINESTAILGGISDV